MTTAARPSSRHADVPDTGPARPALDTEDLLLFPGDFYINYQMYRQVFPMWALGRYLSGDT